MSLPCIKEEREGGMHAKRTRGSRFLTHIGPCLRQNGRYGHFASSHWSAFFVRPDSNGLFNLRRPVGDAFTRKKFGSCDYVHI
jgi:hypothetical protein